MPLPKTGATHYHAHLGLLDFQRSYNQRVGCLLCSMARMYDLWDGSLEKRKVRSLVPCCGYRAEVPQLTNWGYISKCLLLNACSLVF